jgi:hypothetical protein
LTDDLQGFLVACRRYVEQAPGFTPSHTRLVAAYAALGQTREMKIAAEHLMEIAPDFRIAQFKAMMPFCFPDHWNLYGEALRKAGLPE